MNLARAAELGIRPDSHNEDWLQYSTPGRKARDKPQSSASEGAEQKQTPSSLAAEGEPALADYEAEGRDEAQARVPASPRAWRDASCSTFLDMSSWMQQLPIGEIPVQHIRLPVRSFYVERESPLCLRATMCRLASFIAIPLSSATQLLTCTEAD